MLNELKKARDIYLPNCPEWFEGSLGKVQLEQIECFFARLRERNKELNLTARDSLEELAILHFLDSLYILNMLPKQHSLNYLDLGTGAGIPGVILKILLPNYKTVLIDARQKRLKFLDEVIAELALQEIITVHGRFEDLAHEAEFRGEFQVVTARAVAELPVLLEYAAGFLARDGVFLGQKGSQAQAELAEAQGAMRKLNLSLLENFEFTLPVAEAKRAILKFALVANLAKKYPRSAAQIQKAKLI
ncbi:MAG: 16S rRNA (guanine(527)-N(7))-methyltransferase RsmG [Eubacteriales bacterium]|nr:16S rRNA (guanine(527)-N(7))-methyltransferase RsmG [Eubacteriales bacterium]